MNSEENRVQIIFHDKPDTDVRATLKQSGFRWAPAQVHHSICHTASPPLHHLLHPQGRGRGICLRLLHHHLFAFCGHPRFGNLSVSVDGVLDEANIPSLQEQLSSTQSFRCYAADCYEEYLDMSDAEYRNVLESRRDEIAAFILEQYEPSSPVPEIAGGSLL